MLTEKNTQRKSTIAENDEEVGIWGSECFTLIILSLALARCFGGRGHAVLTFCETACSSERNVFHNTKKRFPVPAINLRESRQFSPLASRSRGRASGCR